MLLIEFGKENREFMDEIFFPQYMNPLIQGTERNPQEDEQKIH